MTYFAIRNIDTQMWFRGKGVNKWGKFLNQASIYRVPGQALSTLSELQGRGENVEIVELDIFEHVMYRWTKPTQYSEPYCSNCGMSPHMNFGTLPEFCPHCGKHMKEEVYKLYEES